MPNYSLVTPTQRVISFEDIIKPYQLLQAEYEKMDTQAEALEDLADSFADIAALDPDSKFAQTYNIYNNKLKDLSTRMADGTGNLGDYKNTIRQLTREYKKNILPMQSKYADWKKAVEEQRKVNQDSGNTAMFDRVFANMSLDEIADNSNWDYNTLTGKDIEAQTNALAKPLAESLLADPKYSQILGGQKYKIAMQYGASPLDILVEMSSDQDIPEEYRSEAVLALRGIRNNMHQRLSRNPAYNAQLVNPYITSGLYGALGKSKVEYSDNKNFMTAAQKAANNLGWARLKEAHRHNVTNEGIARDRLEMQKTKQSSRTAGGGTTTKAAQLKDAVAVITSDQEYPNKVHQFLGKEGSDDVNTILNRLEGISATSTNKVLAKYPHTWDDLTYHQQKVIKKALKDDFAVDLYDYYYVPSYDKTGNQPTRTYVQIVPKHFATVPSDIDTGYSEGSSEETSVSTYNEDGEDTYFLDN